MSGCLVAICGETAVGKTTLRCFLRNNTRAYSVATRDPLEEHAPKFGLPVDSAGLQKTWAKLAKRHGDDVIWQFLHERLTDRDEPVLIVEGLRRLVDLEEVRKLAVSLERELLLVYLHAEAGERFHRYNKRQQARDEEPISEKDWAVLEADETASQLELVMAAVEEDDSGILIDTTMTTSNSIGERVINALPAALTDPVD